jgi:hypothetical protein
LPLLSRAFARWRFRVSVFALDALFGSQIHGFAIGQERNFPIRIAKIALAVISSGKMKDVFG